MNFISYFKESWGNTLGTGVEKHNDRDYKFLPSHCFKTMTLSVATDSVSAELAVESISQSYEHFILIA
jgi:hypothetical protein